MGHQWASPMGSVISGGAKQWCVGKCLGLPANAAPGVPRGTQRALTQLPSSCSPKPDPREEATRATPPLERGCARQMSWLEQTGMRPPTPLGMRVRAALHRDSALFLHCHLYQHPLQGHVCWLPWDTFRGFWKGSGDLRGHELGVCGTHRTMGQHNVWDRRSQHGASSTQARLPDVLQVLLGLERTLPGADPGDRVQQDPHEL